MWIPERVNKAGNVVPAFQVDDCFAEEVGKYSWHLSARGYMTRGTRAGGRSTLTTLHKFVWHFAGRQEVSCIDHINGNVLDNRLENLRVATSLLNNKNNKQRKRKKNGLPQGVSQRRPNSRCTSVIVHRGKPHSLGTYDTAEEASAVYQNAKEILIEFANLPGYENVLTGGIDR